MFLSLATILLITKDITSFTRTGCNFQCGTVTLCQRTGMSKLCSLPLVDLNTGCGKQRRCKDRCQVTVNASDTETVGHITAEYPVPQDRMTPGPSQQCLYKLQTQPGYKIKLNFKSFDIPPRTNGRCQNFLKIFKAEMEWSDHQRIFCDDRINPKCYLCGRSGFVGVTSLTNRMTIFTSFRPYGSRKFRGFQAHWHITDAKHRPLLFSPEGTKSLPECKYRSTKCSPITLATDHTSHTHLFIFWPILGGAVALVVSLVIFIGIYTGFHVRNKNRQNSSVSDDIIPYNPEEILMQNLPTPPAYAELTQAPPPYPGCSANLSDARTCTLEPETAEAPPPYSIDNEHLQQIL